MPCCSTVQKSVREKGMFFEVSETEYITCTLTVTAKLMSPAMRAEMKVYLDP